MPKGYNDKPKCTGHTRAGKRCKRNQIPPTDKCFVHGGSTPRGIASPHYKHGRNSRYLNSLPETVRGAFNGHMDDPELVGVHEELAVITIRIEELLQRIPGNDGGNLWQTAYRAFQQFRRASQNRDMPPERRAELMATHLEQLDAALQQGHTDYALWGEVVGLIDKRRALVETATRIEYNRHNVLSANDAALYARYVIRATLSAIDGMDVDEKHKRRAKQSIQDDMLRILSSMNARLPEVSGVD